MPATNPFIDYDAPTGAVAAAGPQPTSQSAIGGVISSMNPFNMGTDNSTNAAGSSENVALHVALMVATALVLIYVLQKSGFRFVIAASTGASVGR